MWSPFTAQKHRMKWKNTTIPGTDTFMTKLRAITTTVFMAFACIPQLHGQVKIDEFASSFKGAASPRAKLDLCVKAIDEGMIARGCSVKQIDQMFGTHYGSAMPKSGSLETGVVDFSPMATPPSNSVAAAHVGWYLAFEFDSSGSIQNYYLSNTHK